MPLRKHPDLAHRLHSFLGLPREQSFVATGYLKTRFGGGWAEEDLNGEAVAH